jgi:acyl carrier protein
MPTQLETEIRAFVAQSLAFADDPETIDLERSLVDQGVLDSTSVLDLIFFVEDRFGVKVADEDVTPANLGSVVSIAAFVEARRLQRAS